MQCESALLAREDGFGSVTRCGHGLVHVQLGVTTLTLTDGQYQRFVAMLVDSAASYEMRRHANGACELDEGKGADTEGTDADYSNPFRN